MAEIKAHINHISPPWRAPADPHKCAMPSRICLVVMWPMAEHVEMNNSRVRSDKAAVKGISVIKIRAQ